MKFKFYLFLLSISLSLAVVAQNDSGKLPPKPKTTAKPVITPKDTLKRKASNAAVIIKKDTTKKAGIKTDSLKRTVKADSLKRSLPDSSATSKDSTLFVKKDSVSQRQKAVHKMLTWQTDTLFKRLFNVPYLPVNAQPLSRIDSIRPPHSKDELFYVLTGVLFFLGFIRLFFPRYFQNMFRLFFQTSFRQKQSREQLLQDRLPSLLMNIFFICVGGIFIGLAATRNNWLQVMNFWWMLLYCAGLLAGIYIVKYIVLQFIGWVFNARESISTYSFIVFLINKMLAVALLPLLLLYAFSDESINKVLITITACVVILMLLYRYAVSLSTIRGNLKVSALHFFIYLCAVEIVPMILLYKVLFKHVLEST